MMAAIGQWVRSLIFLVLFAAFFELLLPGLAMKKFLRVIIGLFLLVAVLKPVTLLCSDGFNWSDVPVFKTVATDRQTVDFTADKRIQLTQTVYQTELERQLRAVVESIPQVKAAQVTVRLNTTGAAMAEIDKVQLRVKTTSLNKEKAGISVNLSKPLPGNALTPKLHRQIVERVSSLYQIPQDKISVSLWE